MPSKTYRSRAAAQQFVDALTEQMPERAPRVKRIEWHLLGSWRRGSEQIGDLDVLVVQPSGTLRGIELPQIFRPSVYGQKLARGHLVLGPRKRMAVDFWGCPPRSVGAFMMYATGPQSLTIHQRTVAQHLGYSLNQWGLWSYDRQIDNGTERGIYELLGLDWLEPEERELFGRPGKDAAVYLVASRSGGPDHQVRIDSRGRAECDTACTWWRIQRTDCSHIKDARRRHAGKRAA